MCLASGNQRSSCYRSRNEPLLFSQKKVRPALVPRPVRLLTRSSFVGESIDYKTSMITDEEPLRGLLLY